MNHVRVSTPVLVAMLKAPRTGFVKTRLAQKIGDDAATAVYRRLVEHQMSAVPLGWGVEVHFTPADAAVEMRQWLGSQHAYYPQAGGNLGERLIHATAGAFERRASAVIVIGGDCPGLDQPCLLEAWTALRSDDVVLGPALDGGYYLVGVNRPVPEIFRGIPWSSPAVLKTTVDRLRHIGLSHTLLSAKEDVDDLASWRRLQATLPPVAADAFPSL